MLFNLNLPVKVRLTVKGVKHLESYHYEQIKKYNLPYEEFRLPETDKNGWTKFRAAHELFMIFGGYNWMCNEPFGMEVEFLEK